VSGEWGRLAEVPFFVCDTAALLADVFGVVDKGFELLEVDVTLATGQGTEFVLSTTFCTCVCTHLHTPYLQNMY
jgi:hypothetical protein